MSGGHYSGSEYKCLMLADNLHEDIKKYGKEYPKEIISKMGEAQHCLRRSYEMVKLIDLLISGDVGEESFLERWKDEVRLCKSGEVFKAAEKVSRAWRDSECGTFGTDKLVRLIMKLDALFPGIR